MAFGRPLNEFGYQLLAHCERQGKSIHLVAREAKLKAVSRIYYAISPRSGNRRSTPLSEKELKAIISALGLPVEAGERLMLVAQIEEAPECLREYVRHLENCNPTHRKT